MKGYSIEEWHDGLVNGTIDVSLYYQQLQKETYFQQKRLNALTTICFQNSPQNLSSDSLLTGVPSVHVKFQQQHPVVCWKILFLFMMHMLCSF